MHHRVHLGGREEEGGAVVVLEHGEVTALVAMGAEAAEKLPGQKGGKWVVLKADRRRPVDLLFTACFSFIGGAGCGISG